MVVTLKVEISQTTSIHTKMLAFETILLTSNKFNVILFICVIYHFLVVKKVYTKPKTNYQEEEKHYR